MGCFLERNLVIDNIHCDWFFYKKNGSEYNLIDFNGIKKGDIIKVTKTNDDVTHNENPISFMNKFEELLVCSSPYLSLDLPEGTKCINVKVIRK